MRRALEAEGNEGFRCSGAANAMKQIIVWLTTVVYMAGQRHVPPPGGAFQYEFNVQR